MLLQKICLRPIQSLLVVFPFFIACGDSGSNIAIPGNIYAHKTNEIKLLLRTRQFVTVFATIEWSICKKKAFEAEIKYFYLQSLNTRIEHELMDAMREVAANIENTNMLFSDATNAEIKRELSDSLKHKGLCVGRIKIYPYNKTIQSTANTSVELSR